MKTTVRAIIKKGNRYLLVQRNEEKAGGLWQFPGGKVDKGSPINALKREIKEETGMNITKINKAKSHYNKKMKQNTICYKVNAKGKIKIQESELMGYGWFKKSEAKELPLTIMARRCL